jgi:hypothetical protein
MQEKGHRSGLPRQFTVDRKETRDQFSVRVLEWEKGKGASWLQRQSDEPSLGPLSRGIVSRPFEHVADKGTGVEYVTAFVRELVLLVPVGEDELRK